MSREVDMTKLLNQLKTDEMKQAEFERLARDTYIIYEAFVNAGFKEDQALAIIINVFTGRK